jgi:dolichol-phosphate mannosyltransferase
MNEHVTLSIIIPAYNEKATIQQLLTKVLAVPIPGREVIVVDDFSTDGTREILSRIQLPDVTVVLQPRNMGKGAALRAGLLRARGDVVIPQDSDLELEPAQILELFNHFKKNLAEAVYGSRFKKAAFSLNPYFLANFLLSVFTSLLFFRRITDMETCYKMVKRERLLSLGLRSNRFDIEPEVTAKLLKRGIRILEMPIAYTPRSSAQGKKIKLKDAFSAVWTLLKYRFID